MWDTNRDFCLSIPLMSFPLCLSLSFVFFVSSVFLVVPPSLFMCIFRLQQTGLAARTTKSERANRLREERTKKFANLCCYGREQAGCKILTNKACVCNFSRARNFFFAIGHAHDCLQNLCRDKFSCFSFQSRNTYERHHSLLYK